MDKVKAILGQVQKHHFWLLCVLAMTAGFVGWFMARKSLMADYEKNKGSITGKFSALQGILQTESHPNGEWSKKVAEMTDKEKQLVRTAWESIYSEQQKQLEWPPEMGDDFLKFITNNPATTDIPRDFRARYQDRIVSSEFPRLLAIVDAQSHEDASTKKSNTNSSGKADAAEDAPVRIYKVIWEESSQTGVQKSFSFKDVPSSAQVRQAQEDIWAYKALLNVIKAMNENSFNAKVRRISAISIGQNAVKPFQAGMSPNRIEKLRAPASDAPPEQAPPPTPAEEGVEKPIDENRYVDADGKPLPGGEAARNQFKRMPIFMQLAIDQREINKFLVLCANSPLPVEVRHLRIGLDKESTAPKAAGQRQGDLAARSEGESFEVPIEVAGIIYIYNPPDVSKLGGAEASPASATGQ